MTGAVTDISIRFNNLTHGSVSDIDVLLVAPSGENLVPFSDVAEGRLLTTSSQTITLADGGTALPPSGSVLSTGTYAPLNSSPSDSFPSPAPSPSSDTTFSEAFTGIDPNGTWRLYVVDDVSGETGSMAGGWSLIVTTANAAVDTDTAVVTSQTPSTTGDSVTFTATVTENGTGNPITSGTVQFADNGTSFGSPVALNGSGSASISTSTLTEGTHTIRATYSGASGFLGSNGTVSQQVDNETEVDGTTFCNTGSISIPGSGPATPYPSHITVSGVGTVGTVTATLAGLSHSVPVDLDVMVSSPTATKNLVLLSDSGGNSAVSNLDVTFDDAAATAVPSPLVSGTFRPTDEDTDGADSFPSPAPTPSAATALSTFAGINPNGTWSLWVHDDATGDSGTIADGWCLTFTAATSTAIASDNNPSDIGESVTFTATVTSGGNPVTSGTVQFSDGATPLGTPVAVNGSGVATFTTSALTLGSHTISADYSGTATLATSSDDLSQVVQLIDTSTTIASDNNPSDIGESVTFTATVTSGGNPVTTGTVQFSDGATPLGTPVAVNGSGEATFTTSSLTVGSHTITADYSGTATLATSSDDVVQVVRAATSVGLVSDNNPSADGESVTFTATVTSGGNPVTSGTVQFSDGATPLGTPVAVDGSGEATFTTSSLTVGSHTITADYSGTATLSPASDNLVQVVRAITAVAIVSDNNPSTDGESVTFTATVTSGGSPVTTGTVQFSDGPTPLGTPIAVNGSGEATFTTSSLTVGSHTITADYSGTSTLAPATSGDLVQVVRAITAVAIVSDNNPSTDGESVTFTATVTSGGNPVTTGTVQFSDGATPLGTPVAVDGSGEATFTTSSLTVGSHTITADYSGTATLSPASDNLTQAVRAITDVALVSDNNPSTDGESVTFTATVTSGGSPVTTGTVQFSDGATPLGAPVAVNGSGEATFTTSSLTVGSHTITADYSGTATLSPASDNLTQTVRAITDVALVSDNNPSTDGESVTFTATVTSGGSPVTTGTVQFSDGATPLGTPVAVDGSGEATFTTSSLTVGSHTITADYSGTASLAPSTETLIQVVRDGTAVALTSDTNPSTEGGLVVFTATVSSGGSPVTGGSVTFSVDGTPVAIFVALDPNGQARLATSSLSVGDHTIRSDYSGDATHAAGTDSLVQTVRSATATALQSDNNPSAVGEAVTFTATVTAGGSPVTDGTVDFSVDGVIASADVPVNGSGAATFDTSDLTAGTHTILAAYSGTADAYAPSEATLNQDVDPIADAGGPYTVAEGGELGLDASRSTLGLTYDWDLNDDGDFTDASGVAPTLTWSELEDLGIDDGPDSLTIAVRVTAGSRVTIATGFLSVTNTAPGAVITGDLQATVGVDFTLKVGADDPSSADMSDTFTYTVDWGDGSPVETIAGPADPPVTHVYTDPGDYNAVFTAEDKDGGQSGPTSVQVTAVAAPSPSPTHTSTTGPDDPDRRHRRGLGDTLASTGAAIGVGPLILGFALLASGAVMIAAAARRRRVGRHE